MGRFRRMTEKENGNVIIEASFVMTIAVVMVAVLISLAFVVYEQTLLEATANAAASKVANVYSSTARDPEIGYVSDVNFCKTNLYRYLSDFFSSNMSNASTRKGQWFSLYSIKKNRLIMDDPKSVDVEVVGRNGSMLLNQVVVRIKSEYAIPLTLVWGGNNKTTFSVEGRATCIDLLEYFDTVSMIEDDVIKKLDKFTERFTKIINTVDGFSWIWE